MPEEAPEHQRFIGRVKWFNNKNGYGFLTWEGGDMFVHHSALVVPENQFKYLVEGEYVEFKPASRDGDDENARKTASDVTGPLRGPLMCQTRTERRDRAANENDMDVDESPAPRRQRFRGGGPRGSGENVEVGNTEWKLASKSDRGRSKGAGKKPSSNSKTE